MFMEKVNFAKKLGLLPDSAEGSSLGFDSNAQFANYLFNPLYPVEDNPPGIPGGVIDLMLLLQLTTIGLGWRARKPTT